MTSSRCRERLESRTSELIGQHQMNPQAEFETRSLRAAEEAIADSQAARTSVTPVGGKRQLERLTKGDDKRLRYRVLRD